MRKVGDFPEHVEMKSQIVLQAPPGGRERKDGDLCQILELHSSNIKHMKAVLSISKYVCLPCSI